MNLLIPNSPHMSMRKASCYNIHDRGPISSTYSRFNDDHLRLSPPSSPGLPVPISGHRKTPAATRSSKLVRGLIWLTGVAIVVYYGAQRKELDHRARLVGWDENVEGQYEMIEGFSLPNFPTPIVVRDKRGLAKWTVSIPPDHAFPLLPAQYDEICHLNIEVSNYIADLHSDLHSEYANHYDYNHVDPNFIDVAEAEEYRLLPGPRVKMNLGGQHGSIIGENKIDLTRSKVCDRTMTFVMEARDAGLGNSLLMLWTAYGLAQREGRHFFIDDSRWAYGKYAHLFREPPVPSCRPPPRHEMLPCPRHARHIIVSAAAPARTFGESFGEAYENVRKMDVYRQKPIFHFARIGFEALFHINSEDQSYVDDRISDLLNRTASSADASMNGVITGIHVRHGDRHPYEFQYKDSYVPLDRYIAKATSLLQETLHALQLNSVDYFAVESKSIKVIASDNPDVYESEEFKLAFRAQERIQLASKKSIATPTQPGQPAIHKFIDEGVGWEGGFFAGMFWNLGKTKANNLLTPTAGVAAADIQFPDSEETLRLRELVGRAYLMDLSVLASASDQIVCTVSSMGCRVLAVMMGWEKAIERGRWVNIDGNFGWTGVRW